MRFDDAFIFVMENQKLFYEALKITGDAYARDIILAYERSGTDPAKWLSSAKDAFVTQVEHFLRYRDMLLNYCPKCGNPLGGAYPPGYICGACNLVRNIDKIIRTPVRE